MFSQSQGDGLKAFGNVLGGEQICPKALGTFTAWHEAVSAKMNGTVTDENIMAERLSPHVHKEVVFEPPTYYKGYKGNEEFLTLLNCVGEVFGKSFVYGRQWLSPGMCAVVIHDIRNVPLIFFVFSIPCRWKRLGIRVFRRNRRF